MRQHWYRLRIRNWYICRLLQAFVAYPYKNHVNRAKHKRRRENTGPDGGNGGDSDSERPP